MHSAQATYSILYETASINFLGPSQAAFQTSVPYHMSWCRMNMRISLHAGLREAAGVLGRRGSRRPGNRTQASGPLEEQGRGGCPLHSPDLDTGSSPILSRPPATKPQGSSKPPWTSL